MRIRLRSASPSVLVARLDDDSVGPIISPGEARILAARRRARTQCIGSIMEQPRPELIPNPAVRRLSLYLRQLEALKRKDRRTISSKQLGESLGLTDAQVRKDLAYFGQFGHPGIGCRVEDLINKVRHILGTDKTWNVLLVGAGNLGRALMAYKGFEKKGFRLAAVFDADPIKIGKKQGPFPIQGLAE